MLNEFVGEVYGAVSQEITSPDPSQTSEDSVEIRTPPVSTVAAVHFTRG